VAGRIEIALVHIQHQITVGECLAFLFEVGNTVLVIAYTASLSRTVAKILDIGYRGFACRGRSLVGVIANFTMV